MNYLILSCSHRKNSNSVAIAKITRNLIENPHQHPQNISSADSTHTTLIDFAENPIALWYEELWNHDTPLPENIASLRQSAVEADALIFLVPEYAGMATPVAKNVLLMLDASTVAHKPALLVTVSAGIGGSYPVAEMRMSSTKNNCLVWIPNHVIIRNASDFRPPFDKPNQKTSWQRLDYSLKVLYEYADALQKVRQSKIVEQPVFPFGM